MRFIAYSDIHFHHSWPEFNPVEENGLSRWLNIQIDVWNQIHRYADEYDVAATLFAGDLFHKRSYQHTTVYNSVVGLYKSLERPELLIHGNHDRFSPQVNAVAPLNGIGKAVVVTQQKLPWGCIPHDDPSAIVYGIGPNDPVPKLSMTGDTNIILAHGMLQGAKVQNGFEMTTGYKLEDFAEFDLVILGDIHAKQIHGNVLIPGTPFQQNWGDKDLDCGCWLIDTEPTKAEGFQWINQSMVKFLPIKAPKFIVVGKENIEEVLKIEKDSYNYYDFRLARELNRSSSKELKERFPNSYLVVQKETKNKSKISISQKENTPEQILQKYYDLRIKGAHKEAFTERGMNYLLTADPKQVARSHKSIEIEYIKAQNFMTFGDVYLDFKSLTGPIYQVTGTSDDETSNNNGIGKSSLAVEILIYTLFDKLARSSTRSKDRLISDPHHTGKAKNMLCEVGLRISDCRYVLQRYRKHKELGTGSRILKYES